MKYLASLIILLVAPGCDTPSREFRGISPVTVTVSGSTFDVRVKGNMAEAIRINTQYAPRLSGIAPKALVAIEQVSGCRARKLGGDQALIHAKLKCADTKEPYFQPLENLSYECDVDDYFVMQGLGQQVTEMECRRVN